MSTDYLSGRTGLDIILHGLFRSIYTILSIIPCEPRLTVNDIHSEPNLSLSSLISFLVEIKELTIHPIRFCTTSKSLKSTPCCVCIP